MTVHFLNTLSGKKEPLTTLQQGKIKMYCCGATPYSNTHIGHTRTFFSYDLLYRTLKDYGYDVAWARNITDVDDKIIQKASHENKTCAEIVKTYVDEQNEMLQLFSLNRPQHEPKVTENIDQIIDLIQNLIERDFAYASNSGVYFRVRKFSSYGKLSGNKIELLRSGARIEVDESKEDPLDFALWKFAKNEEIRWSSPWGEGRPGWHIECSAMIRSLFGFEIDLHMGGRDLIFPHHECEIAQSEAASPDGQSFCKTWLHTGMVTLYGEKMSKSKQNFVSIKDFLAKYPAEVLRLCFLSVSYSHSLDFTFELANENLKKLSRIYRFVSLVDSLPELHSALPQENVFGDVIFADLKTLVERMRVALFDDLGSANALAVFFEFIKHVNVSLTKLEKLGQVLQQEDLQILQQYWEKTKLWLRTTLGIISENPQEYFLSLKKYGLGAELSAAEIEKKLELRMIARQEKNWALSDTIRDELLSQGVIIQDTPRGTKWTVNI